MTRPAIASLLAAFIVLPAAAVERTPAPTDASVYIISPQDGATVDNPVKVRFGASGVGVAPAGVDRENTGHHHLLVDVPGTPPLDQPIPADDHHRHFGGGQTETTLVLPPGRHTLRLLMGDHAHVPHQPPVMSEQVTIEVR